ncbi:MAG: hypothetical protein WCP52_00885 [Bacteroidota bacterium]
MTRKLILILLLYLPFSIIGWPANNTTKKTSAKEVSFSLALGSSGSEAEKIATENNFFLKSKLISEHPKKKKKAKKKKKKKKKPAKKKKKKAKKKKKKKK